jgi:hypothetical protein
MIRGRPSLGAQGAEKAWLRPARSPSADARSAKRNESVSDVGNNVDSDISSEVFSDVQ